MYFRRAYGIAKAGPRCGIILSQLSSRGLPVLARTQFTDGPRRGETRIYPSFSAVGRFRNTQNTTRSAIRLSCYSNATCEFGGSMRKLKRAVAVLALVGFFIAFAAAQEKPTTPLIPREVLFGNPERSDPQISPDGTQLGYLAPVDGVMNVWIRTLGKADDRAVTADKHRGIRNFLWQYDNQHILYTQDLGGAENCRLYQTHLASRQTTALTPFHNVPTLFVTSRYKF